jgi:hypothetical protein
MTRSRYSVQEVPLFILLGVLGGVLGALFNEFNKRLTIWRKKHVVPYRYRNVLEVVVVATVCATIMFLVPYFNDQKCHDANHFMPPQAASEGVKLLKAAQFYCPDPSGIASGQPTRLNDYALLFFQPSEDSIKMLFHATGNFADISLFIFAMIYFILACWTYGIAVPSGLFIPSLLAGAAVGRLYGEAVQQLHLDTSPPGVYSMIGAAAVLGGMSRMTISLTVILIEATNDYTYGLPLMLTLMAARWVGNLFNDGLYDIHIHLNCVPLLESHSLVGPWEQSRAIDILLARDVMSEVRRDDCLTERATVEAIVKLLRNNNHNAFTIIEETAAGMTFTGLITRRQLCLILDNGCYGDQMQPRSQRCVTAGSSALISARRVHTMADLSLPVIAVGLTT